MLAEIEIIIRTIWIQNDCRSLTHKLYKQTVGNDFFMTVTKRLYWTSTFAEYKWAVLTEP